MIVKNINLAEYFQNQEANRSTSGSLAYHLDSIQGRNYYKYSRKLLTIILKKKKNSQQGHICINHLQGAKNHEDIIQRILHKRFPQ